ncbi:hypothetical protein Q3G72_009375 [Acer saccharum]|nr:hypothetical protein Q3G72_009375 [Acer saccharum]
MSNGRPQQKQRLQNLSMTRRAIPHASSLDEANHIMRGNWVKAIEQHHIIKDQRYSRHCMLYWRERNMSFRKLSVCLSHWAGSVALLSICSSI